MHTNQIKTDLTIVTDEWRRSTTANPDFVGASRPAYAFATVGRRFV